MAGLDSQNRDAAFDLDAQLAEMRLEQGYARGRHIARTLVHEPDLRVVLIAMAADSHIEEHRAKSATSIHVLQGNVRVSLPARAIDVPAGRLLMLEGGVPHGVAASEESAFLLTLGRPA